MPSPPSASRSPAPGSICSNVCERSRPVGGRGGSQTLEGSHFGGIAARPYDGRMPVATPIDATPEQLALIKYDAAGLVTAVVQEEGTGQVLMVGWMNADTVRMTFEQGRTVFWSRSRQEVWRKGDTSGDRQFVRQAYYDCDGDTLLFVVEQEGKGACHTGERSCFFRAFG